MYDGGELCVGADKVISEKYTSELTIIERNIEVTLYTS
jgi:hypothetical protein